MYELFFILLLAGLLMTGAEIFLPGGVLGVLGVLCLVGAVLMGFRVFPGHAWFIALGVMLLLGLSFVVWVKVFPRTPVGRGMTLEADGRDFHGTQAGLESLMGKRGILTTDCRPSGYAEIDGQRVDVMSDGGMIDKGRAVEVVEVEGNRVVVRETAG